MANKGVTNKGRQYLLLANEDLIFFTGHGDAERSRGSTSLRGVAPARRGPGALNRHSGTAAMSIEGSVNGADAVAVSVEPSGGSSTPTSEPLLIAALKPWHPRRLRSRCEG